MRNTTIKILCAAALVLGVTACDKKEPAAGGDDKVAKAEGGEAEGAEGEAAEAGEAEGDEQAAPDLSTDDGKVAFAAKVAGAIANDPANADEILETNGLDRDKLDALMYEIASNPEMRENYSVAFANARSTG